jgi:hypothetical protein
MKKSISVTVVAIILASATIETASGQLPESVKNQIAASVKPLQLNIADSSTGFGKRSTVNQPVTLENGIPGLSGNQGESRSGNSYIFLPSVTSKFDFSQVSTTSNPQRQNNSTFADKAYRVFGECANLVIRNKYPSLSAPKGAETNITVSRR